MTRFDRSIATAERLIAKNGQAIKWVSVVDGVPSDSDKPWKPSEAADIEHDAIICFLPITRESKEFIAYLRGTNNVPTGYVQGLMKGNIDFEPKIKDLVKRGDEILRIRSIDLLSPNGQKVLYTVDFET